SPTTLGSVGQCFRATITSTPNTSNFLNLYQHVSGLGAVLAADVGSWPAGIVKRADIIWGVHSVGTVTANLVFDYSQVGGIESPELIRLIKRSSGCSEWEDVSSEFSHNTAAKTFSIVGNSSFSEYSVATQEGDNSLPVELSEFSAKQELKTVSLKWITDSEIENLGFILERHSQKMGLPSFDGAQDDVRFQIASYLTHEGLGGQGSTNEMSAYEFIDEDLNLEMTYIYYLYDVSYQGAKTLLDSVSIILDETEWDRIPDSFSFGNLYPNPFNPQITVPLALPESAEIIITIYDIRGREVRTLCHDNYPAGRHTLLWNGTNSAGKKAATGVYVISYRVKALESGERFHFNRKVLKLE
ncbi:MAG: hypothetical protein HQ507_08980, partial [Candidatus Marinimicrobia bacterium]|nr:hypothetical protein [Candidatus Neomarinimicrobiota bacterium]